MRRVRLAVRRFLSEPVGGRDARDRLRDAWILHGPRWH
jgi:hypothetical protein